MKVDFWSDIKEAEQLEYTTIDQAIEAYLDDFEKGEEPETVTLYGYRRVQISDKTKEFLAESVIEHVLEYLDEDYGGEDHSDPTPEMQSAAKEFVENIVKEYRVWRCDIVTEKAINTKDWMNKI